MGTFRSQLIDSPNVKIRPWLQDFGGYSAAAGEGADQRRQAPGRDRLDALERRVVLQLGRVRHARRPPDDLFAAGSCETACVAAMTRTDPAVPARGDIAFDTVVMKFGGSSVADADKVRGVAQRLVEAKRSGLRVVGTVSAMGKTTDSLIALAHEVSPQPDGREMDMLLSTGERISCALVAMAIHDLGFEAVSFTGSQAGIVTDDAHGRAKIREIRAQRVLDALDAGKIVLVAGFQGVSTDTNDVTTLGRGGTDATAVALAAALGAACEIYSDVAGVYTSDPRIVPGARKLPRISYEEMLEMSASGAKVLMLRSVELARNHNVRVHSRSTFSQEEGTWIVPAEEVMEHPIISGVTHSRERGHLHADRHPRPARRRRDGLRLGRRRARQRRHDHPERGARRRRALVLGAARGRARHAARASRSPSSRSARCRSRRTTSMGKVSLIGAGMRSHPGVAARMFRTLADLDINLRMISTSPIKISCMIARDEVPTAVRALHDAFELETRADGGGLT